jgi:predicted RND superfamily exporter protein
MKQKLRIPKKGIIIGSTIGLVTLFSATPSYAFSIDDFFNEILGELNSYFESTKNELTAAVNEAWGGMKGEATSAIETGSMDMPNPVASADKLKEQLKGKGNWNESNTVEGAVSAANELERETTRATVESVLGEQGQERTKKEIEATEQTVAQAQELAEAAQTMDASQNILKVIAAQNSQIVSMLGQSRTDGLQARHDAQQTNLMLSQIAEQGASDRRRQNLLIDGINAQYLEIAGFSSLKTTAGE